MSKDLRELETSLEQPNNYYLIALSILCQGYLAAHGEIEVPNDLKEKVKSNAGKTKEKIWWTSALGKDEQSIKDELKAVPDDKGKNNGKKKDVQKLITAIYKNGNISKDNLVANAYSALKSILQGK